MKIKYCISFLFLFTFIISNAQSNYYYYYKGEKVFLTLDKKKVYLTASSSFKSEIIQNLGIINIQVENNNNLNQKRGQIEFTSEPSTIEFYQKYNTLLSKPEIRNVSLFFKRNNGTSIGTSNIFYIKLKSERDYNVLKQVSNQKNITIN